MNRGRLHVFPPHMHDEHSEASQESLLSGNSTAGGVTRALSASLSRGLFASYTYNRHKDTTDAAVGGTERPMGDMRTGSGVNNPSTLNSPPPCMSPSHMNKMCGQRAQTHPLYPPDDYTSLKSNNLDSLCSFCRSSLYFTHLHFL